MATIVWTETAKYKRQELYKNGVLEFGLTTAKKTARIVENISDNLEKWPTTGFPEPLLKNLPHLYRAKHINKRYKIIYRYKEDIDTVYIEDIWDTRRSPKNLTKSLKTQSDQ